MRLWGAPLLAACLWRPSPRSSSCRRCLPFCIGLKSPAISPPCGKSKSSQFMPDEKKEMKVEETSTPETVVPQVLNGHAPKQPEQPRQTSLTGILIVLV